ncbi:hypothetical protein CHU95_19920 [Niveispirillum lacus]|uniref:Uncharacterized protein n=2 Tax=Niveispirillum lacus TaxID=1981099 RepID=A0A255YQG1_9PROT|nr:hypothetical protein CHU95_19920 [Niveispirillum lacus]
MNVYDASESRVTFDFHVSASPIERDGEVLVNIDFRSISNGRRFSRSAGPMVELVLKHNRAGDDEELLSDTTFTYGYQERVYYSPAYNKKPRWKFRHYESLRSMHYMITATGEMRYDDSVALHLAVYTALLNKLAAHPHAGDPIKLRVSSIVGALQRKHDRNMATLPFKATVPVAA